jgi:diguanylate cyclase (GGDEF)-like protein
LPGATGHPGARLQSRAINALLLIAALASLPLLIPSSASWKVLYGRYLAETLVVLPLLAVLWLRWRHSIDRRESRFWILTGTAFAIWGMVTPVTHLLGWLSTGMVDAGSYVNSLPFLLFYLCLFAGLLVHPQVENDPATFPLRALEWTATLVLLLGMMLYFLVVPAALDSPSEGAWSSQLVFWVALDVFLVVWLCYMREVAEQPAWRHTYGWLLAAVAIWAVGDIMLLMANAGLFSKPRAGSAFEVLWLLAFCAVVKATELHRPTAEKGRPAVFFVPPLGIGPLVLYTALPLLLHTLGYRWNGLDPDLYSLRESVALTVTVILTGITLFYFRLFRDENERLAMQETLAREELAHRAFHDELTGLPNRNLFTDRLHMAIEDAKRHKRHCAVLYCDLDQFKVINDSLGHEAGDKTLVTTARRLRDALRKQDTVARLGGDEFAVLLTGIENARHAGRLARKLLATIGEPMNLAGKKHSLTGSIGVAVYPDDGTTEEALLKHADTAMYQSKIHGRNTYRLFTEAMNAAAKERLIIEQGLRTGLMEDQFAVFYQPIVALDSGYAAGYEALVRWQDPQRGYISPQSFIEVAEQTGLIIPIGRWVLETACRWIAGHPSVGEALPTLSVNVSPRQLKEPGMVDHVIGVLEQMEIEPGQLQLEIPESAVLDMDDCLATMQNLRALGLKIAIDDFGTSYSALGRLQELPVDAIKIDRSFVQGIESNSVSEAIVESVVNMANAMGLTVIAEGVESRSELAVISDAGCHAAQGYYFCKPLSAENLTAWFARSGDEYPRETRG